MSYIKLGAYRPKTAYLCLDMNECVCGMLCIRLHIFIWNRVWPNRAIKYELDYYTAIKCAAAAAAEVDHDDDDGVALAIQCEPNEQNPRARTFIYMDV